MRTKLRYASADHPTYEEADKDFVRDWITETAWLIAESFGADRICEGCRTVMRRLDRRQLDGSTCLMHKFAVPLESDAPNPWHLDETPTLEEDPKPSPEPTARAAGKTIMDVVSGYERQLRLKERALEHIANGSISPAIGFARRVLRGEDPDEALSAEVSKSRELERP